MAEEIVMPRLSDTMEEGTIAQWLKREGETVHKGEAILEVETDKATMELPAYSDGVIEQILQGDGATVPVGTVIGTMTRSGEAPTRVSSAGAESLSQTAALPAAEQRRGVAGTRPGVDEAPRSPARRDISATTSTVAHEPAPSMRDEDNAGKGVADGDHIKATPLARNLARQYHIDLMALSGHGSGPGGRIVKLDIERYLARPESGVPLAAPHAEAAVPPLAQTRPTPQPSMADGDEVELRVPNRIQQVMARRVLESKTTVPHFYVTAEADMGAASELRQQLQLIWGDKGKVTYNDLIVRACALSLRAMPEVNTSWRDGQFAVHAHVNVGIAVGLRDGLVVPVIHDADRKGLRELAVEARALIEQARAGKLSPRDLDGGTFTVSNLGMYDVEDFQAIINPPESAILAVGSILEKPVALAGQVVVRPRLRLTLSVDHRVIPGIPAAQFLQSIKRLLQEPLRLGF
jgi:pyruvate dehydrogenase E2 component (dihydrolipoamide acetyltransferase)